MTREAVTSYPSPAQSCPYCGHKLDMDVNAVVDEEKPEPGAFALCMECVAWRRFDGNLRRRVLTDDELAHMLRTTELAMGFASIRDNDGGINRLEEQRHSTPYRHP